MRIYTKVIPRASRNEIEKISDAEYRIRVTAPPEKGKANVAVVEMLAKYFNVSRDLIVIAGGWSAKNKIIDIKT